MILNKIYILILFFACVNYAQTYRDLDIYKGDSHTLSFEAPTDVSSDSLLFVVKADRDDDTPRVIALRNTAGGGSDSEIRVIYSAVSTILVKLTQINTEGLTAALYVYDLTIDSTTTLYTGTLKLRDEVGGSADGVATRTPYYTIAVDTSDKEPGIAIWYDSDNSADYIDFDELKDTIGVYNVTPEQFTGANDSTRFAKMFAVNDTLQIVLKNGFEYDLDAIRLSYDNARYVELDGNGATLNMGGKFLTITSYAAWNGATHTGFQDVDMQTAAKEDTLFSTDFVQDSLWVGVDDNADWSVKENDMLFISDSSTHLGSYQEGGVFVIDRHDLTAKRLYFQEKIKLTLDRTDIMTLRLAQVSGKRAYIHDLNIKNGGIRIGGFEKADVERVTARMDSTTYQAYNSSGDANEDAVEGIMANWNTITNIRDCNVDGYLIVGLGYGVQASFAGVINIDNLQGRDCRHIYTNSNYTSGGIVVNELNITNSRAIFSQRAGEVITTNLTGFDTHAGVWQVNIDNCSQEGGDIFSKLRSNNIKISNSKTNFTKGFLKISAVQDNTSYPRKVILEDNETYNVETVLVFDSGFLHRAEINNHTMTMLDYTGGNAPSVIYSASPNPHIDTLIIQGGDFTGAGVGNTGFIYTDNTNDTTSYFIEYMSVKGANFRQFDIGFSIDSINIHYLDWENNNASSFDDFIVFGGNAGEGFNYGRWNFKSSNFTNMAILNSLAVFQFNDFYFTDNTFTDCDLLATVRAGSSVEELSYTGNTLINTRLGDFSAGTLYFSHNDVFGESASRWFYNGSATKTVMTHNTFHDFKPIGSEFLRVPTPLTFAYNYVEIDSLDDAKAFMINLDGTGNMKALKNTFIIETYTAKDIISGGAGTTITTDDNYFDLTGHANHDAIKSTGGTVIWGVNRYTGVSTPVDTSGNVTATTLSKFGD